MERLTKKISKAVQDKYSLGSYLQYDFAKADDTNKLLNKLGKFEDFMEEQGFESLEEVKRQCDLVVDVLAMDSKNHQLNFVKHKIRGKKPSTKIKVAEVERVV